MNTFMKIFVRIKHCPTRGFVALGSALIFSLILMLLILSESGGVFWTRYDQEDQENQNRSKALAESCMYKALLKYAEDPNSLSQDTVVNLPPIGTCTIKDLTKKDSVLTFVTYAVVDAVPSVLIVSANDTGDGILSVTSWNSAKGIPP